VRTISSSQVIKLSRCATEFHRTVEAVGSQSRYQPGAMWLAAEAIAPGLEALNVRQPTSPFLIYLSEYRKNPS